MQSVVIFGAGGHGREVLQVLMDVASAGQAIGCVGFLVDDDIDAPEKIRRIPVFKSHDALRAALPPNVEFVVALGSSKSRRSVAARLKAQYQAKFATLIHPTAIVGGNVALAEGVVVFPRVVLMTDIVVEPHAHFNVAATISHDCHIGAFVTVNPGVVITGACRVGEGSEIGANAVLRPKITIGKNAVIAAGAAVVSDVPDNTVVMGVPARDRSEVGQ